MSKKIVFLVVFAFILRIVTVLILDRHINPEKWEYDFIALNILSGKGYVFNHLGTNYYLFGSSPLYVYIELLVHSLSNVNYFVLELVQTAFASIAIIPLFYLSKYIFNEKTAMISGLLYCFHPGLIVYTTKIHELHLVVFFVVFILYLLICQGHKLRYFLAAGFLIGLGVLLRPTIILIIPCYSIYLITKKEGSFKIIAKFLMMLLFVAICISPWVYRGYRIHNEFIFITTNSAEHLWRGNNPHASGMSLNSEGKDMVYLAGEGFEKRLLSLDEIGQRNLFKSEAIKFIKGKPVLFLKNTVKKFIYFWYFSPQTGIYYPVKWLIAYKILYYFLLFFFLIGAYFIFIDKRHNINSAPIIFLFSFFIIILIRQLNRASMQHTQFLDV